MTTLATRTYEAELVAKLAEHYKAIEATGKTPHYNPHDSLEVIVEQLANQRAAVDQGDEKK